MLKFRINIFTLASALVISGIALFAGERFADNLASMPSLWPPMQLAFTTPFVIDGAPNDPLVLDDTVSYAPQLLNLFTAWDFQFATDDVVIAVIDTGIAHAHPEFAGRILAGRDLIHDNDDPEDDQGHGTHVAGIVAAAGNNGQGVAGVCGFCKLLPIKVVNAAKDASGAGIAEGIRYAADHGADIALLSLSRDIGDPRIDEAVEYARAKDVLIVAAVGNDSRNTATYPAAYDGVLGVAATTKDDEQWSLSNYGDFVDVAAPGDNIISTYYDLNNKYNGYLFMSGTSMAAPFVAGLAGLLLAQNPDRSADDLTSLITTTAIDLGDPGWDPIFGYGRIDPVAALMAEAPPPPSANLRGSVWNNANLNDGAELVGLAGIPIRLTDSENRLIGLTNTRLVGDWRWVVSAPGIYTITVVLPVSMVVPGGDVQQVSATPGVEQSNVDFPAMTLPTAQDIQDFAAIRASATISLSWTATPLVHAIQIERATAEEGEYTVVGAVSNDEPTAANVQNQFTDYLPTDLQFETLFYRAQLLPGNTVVGPLMVVADAPNAATRIFLPMIQID